MTEERLKAILVVSGSVLMILFCLFPFIYMVLTSIASAPDYLSAENRLEFTLRNYSSVLGTESLHFLDYLRNSLVVSLVSALVAVLTAALAAYSISRLSFPGKMLVLFVALTVSMFPQISFVGYLFKLMSGLGWINTYLALMFPYVALTLPLALWILASYFRQIPRELDKAALIDGCSRWQVLWKVIFPVAAPGLFSTTLLAFIFAFNEFMFALMLTADHGARTIPVGIALFQGLHGEIPWGDIMAASTVTTIPAVVLIVAFQRHIIQGLTRGAVKE